jgi:Secretion system C-terminal sorting domain/FG-GAP repeat
MVKPITFLSVFMVCLSSTLAQDWVQMGNDIDGEAGGDQSGSAVSMSSDGTTVAIGAGYNQGNGLAAGHVRVFTWNDSNWIQKGSDINGEATFDRFGTWVSISSDGKVVAASGHENDRNGVDAGHVRVFAWSGTRWAQMGSDIDGEAAGDEFGVEVSISSDGTTMAIGAPWNDGNGTNAGHVRVFSWSGSEWVQKGFNIEGEAVGDAFGMGLSISSHGNVIAIGGHKNDRIGTDGGHVRVFNWSGFKWTQKGSNIDGEAKGDKFGIRLSMSSDGNTVAIGARRNDGNGTDAGHVRVFAWNGSWIQKGSDIDGEAEGDGFGSSVSMTSDGDALAIGATHNDGNGHWSGHVRVFAWNGKSWIQKGSDIDGEAEGDVSGASVSMSSDGTTLAIGAPGSSRGGHVRIFRQELTAGIKHRVISTASVYPNPSSNSFILNLDQVHQEIELKILDVLGQIVTTKKVESASEIEFEIKGKQGLYIVEISTNDGLLTTVKVIKE